MDERLSSGRHHLSPDQVAADQQKRLFKALAVVMGEKGYSNTTVGDLIKHARVSRATFYQQFESKQDCFMAGYARMQSNVLGGLRATPVSGSPMARFRAMLTNYLNFLAAVSQRRLQSMLELTKAYFEPPQVSGEMLEILTGKGGQRLYLKFVCFVVCAEKFLSHGLVGGVVGDLQCT